MSATATFLIALAVFVGLFLVIGMVAILAHIVSYMLRVIFSPVGVVTLAFLGVLVYLLRR